MKFADRMLTLTCATAMGIELTVFDDGLLWDVEGGTVIYDPLHNDAQAMAMMRRFKLKITWHYAENVVRAIFCSTIKEIASNYQADLNRAICDCVNRIEVAKAARTAA